MDTILVEVHFRERFYQSNILFAHDHLETNKSVHRNLFEFHNEYQSVLQELLETVSIAVTVRFKFLIFVVKLDEFPRRGRCPTGPKSGRNCTRKGATQAMFSFNTKNQMKAFLVFAFLVEFLLDLRLVGRVSRWGVSPDFNLIHYFNRFN